MAFFPSAHLKYIHTNKHNNNDYFLIIINLSYAGKVCGVLSTVIAKDCIILVLFCVLCFKKFMQMVRSILFSFFFMLFICSTTNPWQMQLMKSHMEHKQ